jgi:hypothetical protein
LSKVSLLAAIRLASFLAIVSDAGASGARTFAQSSQRQNLIESNFRPTIEETKKSFLFAQSRALSRFKKLPMARDEAKKGKRKVPLGRDN